MEETTLTSDRSERNSVCQFSVESVLRSNAVVGKDEIILAVEKNSTFSGLAQNIVTLDKIRAMLASSLLKIIQIIIFISTKLKTAVEVTIRALLEVGETAKKNIQVATITVRHGLKRLEQAKIDAICAEIKTKKAASKVDEAEPQVDEIEIEAKKERRKAKKAAAEAARKAPSDEPSVDDTISDHMDRKESQFYEIEIGEENVDSEAHTYTYAYKIKPSPVGKFGIMMRKRTEMNEAAEAAEAAKNAPSYEPLVDVAVFNPEDSQVDQIEIEDEKRTSEVETHIVSHMPLCHYDILEMIRANKMKEDKAAAEAAKNAPSDEPSVDDTVFDQMDRKESQFYEIEIWEEKVDSEAHTYTYAYKIKPSPWGKFGRRMRK